MFCKIGVLKNFTKFTENHLGTCNFNKNSTQILPVNFAKFLRTPLLQNTSVRLTASYTIAKVKKAVFFKLVFQKEYQKQPSRGVLKNRCSKNMQQIY